MVPGVGAVSWYVSANAMATSPMPTPVRYTSRGMTDSFRSRHRQPRQEGAGPALDAVVLAEERPGGLNPGDQVPQAVGRVAAGQLAVCHGIHFRVFFCSCVVPFANG